PALPRRNLPVLRDVQKSGWTMPRLQKICPGPRAAAFAAALAAAALAAQPPDVCPLAFTGPSYVGAGGNPIVVAHFNNDGIDDIATLAPPPVGLGALPIRLGNGDGTFVAQPVVNLGNRPFSMVAGDFNNDGNIDLITTNRDAVTVEVHLGNGNGTVRAGI